MPERTSCTVLRCAAAALVVASLAGCVQRHCLCDDTEINPPNPGRDGRNSAKVVASRTGPYHFAPIAVRAWSAGARPEERTP